MPDVLHPGNDQNQASAKSIRTRSRFDLSYHHFDTHRFGEYHPHFVLDTVNDDKDISQRSSHVVRSYTLGAPLLQNIEMKKDYFMVPREAILPLNWEKFFTNPVVGDDVPDDCGTTVVGFWNYLGNFFYDWWSYISTVFVSTDPTPDEQKATAFFRFLIFAEAIYSDGCLLSSLGCSPSQFIRVCENYQLGVSTQNTYHQYYSFDQFFDNWVTIWNNGPFLYNAVLNFADGRVYQINNMINTDPSSGSITLRHALDLMREDSSFYFSQVGALTNIYPQFLVNGNVDIDFLPARIGDWTHIPLDLARLFAYQLVCAHYYTNDKIDSVYSADLYRSLIFALYNQVAGSLGTPLPSFNVNGVDYPYDACSGNVSGLFLTCLRLIGQNGLLGLDPSSLSIVSPAYSAALMWFGAVFNYRHSLRYQDYFTGSKSQPLAVGNVDVAVNSNLVNVVDVSRNIQKQRFLNAVNRSGRKFGNYLKEIFGQAPAPDYHNPFFLGHTSDVIFGDEVQNTSSDQRIANPITSNLRSNGSRYAFSFDSDRPSIILGLTWYDIPRVYSRSIERPFFHVNRFDMFNPFFQFIGDQPVYRQELGNISAKYDQGLTVFGYQLRHAEYKQRFNRMSGGFVMSLPGWSFIADDEGLRADHIGEDYIRSVPSELDKFYTALTGYSLGTYFHFIVDNFNQCSASRPMAFAPSIL